MLDLDKLQAEVKEWSVRNFGDPQGDTRSSALVVNEEAGEVARAVVKKRQGIRGTDAEWDAKLMEESADTVIALCELAGIAGFSLQTVIAERWGVVRNRDFVTDKVSGGGHR